MVRKALTHPRFSGESTDAQRGRQADQGWRKQRRLHKEARSWQKVGLDQTELAGERKETNRTRFQWVLTVCTRLSLSHTFFMCHLGMVLPCLLPRVAHKRHALRVRVLKSSAR